MNLHERAQYIYIQFRKAGFTYAGAIGMLGCIQGESAQFKSAQLENYYAKKYGINSEEYTLRVDAEGNTYQNMTFVNDHAGYGIVQWTAEDRKEKLLEYARAKGKSIGDFYMQVEYAIKEIRNYYPRTWGIVTTTDSIESAVQVGVYDYERPADKEKAYNDRIDYAYNWAELIKDNDVAIKDDDVMTQNEAIAKLVACAKAEVGYLEKNSNSNLDDKTGNAGSNNWTKYARDIDQKYPHFYNGKKNGYAWCDIFVDWCFITTFGYENALRLLYQPEYSFGAGCDMSAGYYRKNGAYMQYEPQVGDQVFFGRQGAETHTGIVVAVDGLKVTTVEGNTSGGGYNANGDGVYMKTYDMNIAYFPGFGRPNWNAICVEIGSDGRPILSYGAQSEYVQLAQKKLIAKGYSCGTSGADGDFGKGTLNAVRSFQEDCGLAVNGVIDESVWALLMDEEIEEPVPDITPEPEPEPETPSEPTAEIFNPPVLKYGDNNKNGKKVQVKKLQHLLADSGYFIGIAGVDGDFGNATVRAVKRVQADIDREMTGEADKYVWAALIS